MYIGTSLYGSDVEGSLFDYDVKAWKLPQLRTILDDLNQPPIIRILGVTTPFLYFGMWKTSFAWHTEDEVFNRCILSIIIFQVLNIYTSFPLSIENSQIYVLQDLHSLNFHHFGQPKLWYSIHIDDTDKFDSVVDKHFPAQKKLCDAHIRHKEVVMSPDVLRKANIRVDKVHDSISMFRRSFSSILHVEYIR